MVNLNPICAPLFVPANRPDRFAKAALSGADAVILDLEDAVSSDAKDEARAALSCDFTDLPVIIRINPMGTPWCESDLDAVNGLTVAGVMLPKAESPDSVAAVVQRLKGQASVLALIETARGLAAAREIASVSGVTRLVFGSVDFCADLGCAHLRELLLPAQFELMLASRLAGIVAPIDGITTQFNDPVLTFADAVHARNIGMSGKLCIHPNQIPEVRRAFIPSDTEIDWARRVLAHGKGAVSVDGAMVDEPVRVRARAILTSARLL